MSRHQSNGRSGADRASLYDDITNKIIAELEAGRVPWVQPWGTAAAKAPLAMPANAATGRAYSGINVLILWGAVIEHGFPVQSWLTFRQALLLGGHVRKGEPAPPSSTPTALSPTTRRNARRRPARKRNRAIVRAASQASKATDWLLAFLPETDTASESANDRRAA